MALKDRVEGRLRVRNRSNALPPSTKDGADDEKAERGEEGRGRGEH